MAIGRSSGSRPSGLPGGIKRKGMTVANAKLGNKLTCSSCGAKFYDLKKKQPACPKCGEDYVEQKPKTRRVPTPAEPVQPPAPNPESDSKTESEEGDELIDSGMDDDLLEEDSGGDDDTVIEDTSDIGGDEEDIGEVIGAVDGASDDNI